MARVDRGWAAAQLSWEWHGVCLEASIARCRYYVLPRGRELIVWGELREPGGRKRIDIGSFPDVGQAKAACERHAAGLLAERADAAGDRPVDVRIVPVRRRPGRAAREENRSLLVTNKLNPKRDRPLATLVTLTNVKGQGKALSAADRERLDRSLAAFARVFAGESADDPDILWGDDEG